MGVEQLVLLSARMAAWGGGAAATLAAVEDAVRGAGLPTSILRPTWFQQGFSEDVFGAQLRQGGLRLPEGELRDPFIDVGDIAEVAAVALTSAQPLEQVVDPFDLVRDPRNHHLSTGVQDILGRPPRDLAVYAADAAATGAWASPVAA